MELHGEVQGYELWRVKFGPEGSVCAVLSRLLSVGCFSVVFLSSLLLTSSSSSRPARWTKKHHEHRQNYFYLVSALLPLSTGCHRFTHAVHCRTTYTFSAWLMTQTQRGVVGR